MSLRKNLDMAHFGLQTAEDDLKAANALLNAGLPAHACFAAQQCGENAMEALWYLAGKDPWGHSVISLVTKLPQRDDISAIATWKEKAVGLDWYDNGFRPSTGLPELTPGRFYLHAEAQNAIEMARYLLDASKEIIAAEEAKLADIPDGAETGLLWPYITSMERFGYWRGQLESVLYLLTRRFGAVPPKLEARLRAAPRGQMPALLDVALTATTLAEVAIAVETLPPDAGNGVPPPA